MAICTTPPGESKPEPYPDIMTITPFTAAYSTLAEAIAASGYDVSYNPAEYRRKIADTDKGSERHGLSGTIKAYVFPFIQYGNPLIRYTVLVNGALFLHTFSLHGCLSSNDLEMYIIDENVKTFTQTGVFYAKNPEGRKAMKELTEKATGATLAFA